MDSYRADPSPPPEAPFEEPLHRRRQREDLWRRTQEYEARRVTLLVCLIPTLLLTLLGCGLWLKYSDPPVYQVQAPNGGWACFVCRGRTAGELLGQSHTCYVVTPCPPGTP